MKNYFRVFVITILINGLFCIPNVKKEHLPYISESGAVQNELGKVKSFLFGYSKLDGKFTQSLWEYANKKCNFKDSTKINIYLSPFYELKNENQYCYWNFRKELITYSINDPEDIQNLKFLLAHFYKDKPTGLILQTTTSDWKVERNHEWNLSKNNWRSLLVKLEFEHIKTGRIITYHVHRETNEILKKEEFLSAKGERQFDGWQFKPSFLKNPEVCHYYENGKFIEDKKECLLMENAPLEVELSQLPTLPAYERSWIWFW